MWGGRVAGAGGLVFIVLPITRRLSATWRLSPSLLVTFLALAKTA